MAREEIENGHGLGRYCNFKDTDGGRVALQDSSAAMVYAGDCSAVSGPFCWLFVDSDDADGRTHSHAHLTVEHAQELRDALDEWLRLVEAEG